MRKIILLLILATGYHVAKTQNVAINNTGTAANPSAILDISSNSKGILIPRMTTLERTAIQNIADALLVYDTDTRSFWYYHNNWRELLTNGSPLAPSGGAYGDLSGTYPSPNVAKIQNLDVAFGVPFDRQAMKWDMLNNRWQAANDSLFLPYNVSYGSPTRLFGITNTNTTGGSVAVFGRNGAGSGVFPAFTMGVWGDNATGAGLVGTSTSGQGIYGYSANNNGVQGYSSLAGTAGVYGAHASPNGIGVMGDMQNNGIGIYGRVTGSTGKAGFFESSSIFNTDTTMKVSTSGLGILSSFNITSPFSTKQAIDIFHGGNGGGIKLRLTNPNNVANGIDILSSGTGSALAINSSNTGFTGNVVDVLNQGSGFGLNLNTTGEAVNANLKSSNIASYETDLVVEQNGKGKGIAVTLSNASNLNAGVYVNTAGNKGVEVVSAGAFGVLVSASGTNPVAISGNTGQSANNGIAVKGTTGANVSNGIGVLGQSGVNDATGIGVKGTSYSGYETMGAVTGLNYADGVGVYGEATGFDGIGVAGTVGNTSNHSVAAVFTNTYANNNRAVMELITNGKGNAIFSDNTNAANTSPIFRGRNAGTGKYLQFETNLGDVQASIAKGGDFTTDGTVTVKGDKGIIRNSSSTQLRTEILSATFSLAGGNVTTLSNLETRTVHVNFGTAFPSAPTVYIGNMTADSNGSFMNTLIKDVTTTGCDLFIRNVAGVDINLGTSTWKIIAIGAE